ATQNTGFGPRGSVSSVVAIFIMPYLAYPAMPVSAVFWTCAHEEPGTRPALSCRAVETQTSTLVLPPRLLLIVPQTHQRGHARFLNLACPPFRSGPGDLATTVTWRPTGRHPGL